MARWTYYWSLYTAGKGIVVQDMYMVGNNVAWFNEWHTPYALNYCSYGCDNEQTGYVPANSGIGTYLDVSDCLASLKTR